MRRGYGHGRREEEGGRGEDVHDFERRLNDFAETVFEREKKKTLDAQSTHQTIGENKAMTISMLEWNQYALLLKIGQMRSKTKFETHKKPLPRCYATDKTQAQI